MQPLEFITSVWGFILGIVLGLIIGQITAVRRIMGKLKQAMEVFKKDEPIPRDPVETGEIKEPAKTTQEKAPPGVC